METSAIPGWTDFFVATAGVAGALAGLVFVSISINLEKILQLPSAINRAGETLPDVQRVGAAHRDPASMRRPARSFAAPQDRRAIIASR